MVISNCLSTWLRVRGYEHRPYSILLGFHELYRAEQALHQINRVIFVVNKDLFTPYVQNHMVREIRQLCQRTNKILIVDIVDFELL